MNADAELESWRRNWQATSAVPPDLNARVERETRWMRRVVVGEIIITVVFGGGSLAWAVVSGRTDALVLAIGVWTFIAMAWGIAFLLRRDAWAPAALGTAAFLDLSILRCRRKREAVVAQSVLYVLILCFDLAWIYFARSAGTREGLASFLTSSGVAWVWAVTVALGAAAVVHRRRLARELETLTNLRQQLGDDLNDSEGGSGIWRAPTKAMKRSRRRKSRGGASARN